MRIIIDGDSCPVIEQAQKIARNFNIELILFCDYNHEIKLKYGKVVKVDQSYQSVDMQIINFAKRKDIIITNDYGLASLALSKKAAALNSKGKIFTDNNIDTLLMKRHINKKIRRGGGKHPTAKKRRKKDDERFKKQLISLIRDLK